MDLALNNLQRLICHKTQLTNQKMRGYKPWPMKNKYCVGEEARPCGSRGSFQTIKGLEIWLKFSFRWLFRLPKYLCVCELSLTALLLLTSVTIEK